MIVQKKKRIRDGHPVNTYIDPADMELLRKNEFNVAQLIRDTIRDTAAAVRTGKASFTVDLSEFTPRRRKS